MAAEDLIQLFVQKLSLSETGLLNSIEFATNNSLEHQKVVGAVKSLQSMNMVVAEQIETKRLELTGEGKQIVENGSHEYRIWEALPETGGIEQPVLIKKISDENVAKLGFTKAMSNKWIAIDKSSGKPLVIRKATTVVDEVRHVLQLVQDGSSNKVRPIYY